MIERRKQELELVRKKYGNIEHGVNLEWVTIKQWQLPLGWNKTEISVLLIVPPGYPTTPPDNFYTDNDLRLSSSTLPGNTNANVIQLERPWLQFSYHVESADWRPNSDLLLGHNLMTFLQGIAIRLCEAN